MARNRRVALTAASNPSTATATAKKGNVKERKLETIEAVQKALRSYPHVYLYRLENARNAFFQRVRRDLSESSVFWLGRNRVLQRALGKDAQSAVIPGAEQVSKGITGSTGLLFPRLGKVDLQDALSQYSLFDFARAGSIAPFDVTITPEPGNVLCRQDTKEPISATLEPMLRNAGVQTMLRGGNVLLATGTELAVCREGDRLSENQARILKAFGIQLDEFAVKLTAHFDCQKGTLGPL
jgi:mRNA turnover protein 4